LYPKMRPAVGPAAKPFLSNCSRHCINHCIKHVGLCVLGVLCKTKPLPPCLSLADPRSTALACVRPYRASIHTRTWLDHVPLRSISTCVASCCLQSPHLADAPRSLCSTRCSGGGACSISVHRRL
jgi:hypothetical protein